jgi:hypothetical protein
MKYLSIITTIALLSGCVSAANPEMDPELAAHLEAERDFAYHQYYLKQVHERKAFRPEVYADPEFLSDCEVYEMEECYE